MTEKYNIKNFDELLQRAQEVGPKTVAVAAAAQYEVLHAVADAQQRGIVNAVLVDDAQEIERIADEEKIDLSGMQIVDATKPAEAAQQVMRLVGEYKADVAMKGRVETGDFLRAALDKQYGLRTGSLFSHVAVFEIPGFDRLIFITDAGVTVAPDLNMKVILIQNAIDVAHKLGISEPKVAVLAATETVNAKIPTTLDAASLAKMADRHQIRGGVVDGPLALDNAISAEAALIKGIDSPVAGKADILVTPDIEAGNMLAKAISYFANGEMAGVVVGARVPLIVASRADPHRAKLVSIALGVMLAAR